MTHPVTHGNIVEAQDSLAKGSQGILEGSWGLEYIKLYALGPQAQATDFGQCVPGESLRTLDLC